MINMQKTSFVKKGSAITRVMGHFLFSPFVPYVFYNWQPYSQNTRRYREPARTHNVVRGLFFNPITQ